jgi:cation-transporting ATPase 13A1
MEGATKMRAELEHSLGDVNDPNRRIGKMGWFEWMDMDLEEHAAQKKREKEKTVLDALPKHMRVPSKWSPSFVPGLLLGILMTLHALVLLLQHWSVAFHTWINYSLVKNVESIVLPDDMMELSLDDAEDIMSGTKKSKDGKSKGGAGNSSSTTDFAITEVSSDLPTHARIVPTKGRHLLVPIVYYPTLGMTFEYHRRRYVLDSESAEWKKIRCRTDIPLPFFGTWKGFASPAQLVGAYLRYGPNQFQMTQPTFSEMYKKQLLSPFTVFQLFCVILWMLDDYWQYSAFTLIMVLTFEGTVVFSRLKSLQALQGMGNQTRPVYVYRLNKWAQVDSTALLPGDLMSLTRIKPHYAKEDTGKRRRTIEDEGGDVVPVDLLLLSGSTVVNEASLTGESVPQMKEGLVDLGSGNDDDDDELAMKTTHKSHICYAGTNMLQIKGDETNAALPSGIPAPPDGGAVTFCLRTGFSSAQGKLVRMIEGSQEKVKGHEKETGLLLLLLFFFAVASSSYVLYHGLQNDKRSQYELLLHCILIITSVIPPELPMQMALAVNNSLMTLMKLNIFCTEPFRVPMAGKLDSCLFDKTGTLTTDELVAVGVCETKQLVLKKNASEEDKKKLLTPMTKVGGGAALVLAGCHSLVFIDEETTGDPLESASLQSMRWTLSPNSGNVVPAAATEKKEGGKIIDIPGGSNVSELEIVTRHHFSSKLQRMSCVVRSTTGGKAFAVAKGSPEAIGSMLVTKPAGYDDRAKQLAKEGYRVISLAYKILDSTAQVEACKDTRSSCESDLVFAGFVAFTCRVRKDTAMVLKKLKEGGMSIAMVTGDAILTAIHVSKEVGICTPVGSDDDEEEEDLREPEPNPELRALLESKRGKTHGDDKNKQMAAKEFKPILLLEKAANGSMFWQSYEDDSKVADLVANEIPDLSKKYDLATTGKSLAAAFEYDEGTKSVLGCIKVFARMTPDAKETVIECLHSVGALCLMCGDGANDVGALKQADVGVALLSGFGDLNVDRGEDGAKKATEDKKAEGVDVTAIMSQEHIQAIRNLPVMLIKTKIRQLGAEPDKYPEIVEKEDLVKLYQIKAREVAIRRHRSKNAGSNLSKAEQVAKARADAADKQQRMMARVAELEAQGVPWAQFKAMKEFYNQEMEVSKKKKRQHGTIEGSAAAMATQFEDMETGDLPMIKIGDASVAAPFTSKMPSIRSCVDIVRQGRCTLVSSIQMYQILALNCLISSYSLSVLYLDGVKYGDTQMTAMGMLGSISFMSVSRSKPLDKLSKVRPLTSIFHPALFLSLLGQFAIHLTTMVLATQTAKQHLPPDHEIDLDGIFKPGILNTVVFLVSNVQQVCVFVVNLQGRPFMTGLTENRPLLWSLLGTFILTFMFASESVPGLNKYFQLVPFPDDEFRDYILKILAIDVTATFFLDRILKFIFCPRILFASVEGTTLKDVLKLSRTIGVMLFLMWSFLGNDDQWEELMLQEGRLEELGLNATNMTNSTTTTEAILETVAECVGEACKAAVSDGASDEF